VVGRTQTIGLVVTNITDPFIAEVVQAVENTAHEHGYSVILASSHARREREIAAVETLRSKRVDAVIVTSSRVGALYQEYLDRLGVPVVLLNSHSTHAGPYTFSVNVDNRHGASLATGHLLALGHTRVAYVRGAADHSDDRERLEGYRQALAAAGVFFDPTLVVPGTGRTGGGQRALPLLLERDPPPTAVFCYNDMTAIGLMREAERRGVCVPHDLAVAGFDDVPFASYVSPRLTTVAQPKRKMGRRAMDMALELMDREVSDLAHFSDAVFQGELVVRQSSGAKTRPA
jgi:DNA-binding LacI/PurR family transcriptional regulator